MDQELQKLIKETFRLAAENNRLLHKVRNYQRRETFFFILKWVVIFGVGVGAFYFMQPYVDAIKDFVHKSESFINEASSLVPKK